MVHHKDNEAALMISAAEAGRLLDLRVETIRRLLDKGKLPGIKIGKHWRISITALSDALCLKQNSLHPQILAGYLEAASSDIDQDSMPDPALFLMPVSSEDLHFDERVRRVRIDGAV